MANLLRALCVPLAAGFVLTATAASAQEGTLFLNLMRGMGVGGERDAIDYRERPPLVVPPSSQLPRPQAPVAERTAAWPNDPDVARRRAEAAAARIPNADNEKFRNNPLLSQQELRRGRTDRRTGAPIVAEDHNNYNNQIAPIRIGRELAARQSAEDLAALQYGTEPPRRTLSEPPVGYRRPAGTAPMGPGAGGPREDRQNPGQREFLTGQIPLQ